MVLIMQQKIGTATGLDTMAVAKKVTEVVVMVAPAVETMAVAQKVTERCNSAVWSPNR